MSSVAILRAKYLGLHSQYIAGFEGGDTKERRALGRKLDLAHAELRKVDKAKKVTRKEWEIQCSERRKASAIQRVAIWQDHQKRKAEMRARNAREREARKAEMRKEMLSRREERARQRAIPKEARKRQQIHRCANCRHWFTSLRAKAAFCSEDCIRAAVATARRSRRFVLTPLAARLLAEHDEGEADQVQMANLWDAGHRAQKISEHMSVYY